MKAKVISKKVIVNIIDLNEKLKYLKSLKVLIQSHNKPGCQ